MTIMCTCIRSYVHVQNNTYNYVNNQIHAYYDIKALPFVALIKYHSGYYLRCSI